MLRIFQVGVPFRTLVLALSEGLLAAAAMGAAARTDWGGAGAFRMAPAGAPSAGPVLAAAGIVILCLYYFDLYDSRVMADARAMSARLVQGLGTACLILAGMEAADPGGAWPRAAFAPGLALMAGLLLGWRGLFFAWNRSRRLAEPTLMLGEGPLAEALTSEIGRRPELGLRLVRPAASGAAALAGVHKIAEQSEFRGITRVVVALPERRGVLPVEDLLELSARGVRVEDGAALYESLTGRLSLESLRLSDFLFRPAAAESRRRRWRQRALSLLIAAPALALTLPIWLLLAAAIRLDSPGPVIFRQARIGWRGRRFTLYKFRSMRADADADGHFTPALPGDERCTRLGAWLRRSRLDELPQLLNILRGDMDLVGPRPFVPNQELDLAEQIPYYRQRWAARPGVTGWAQVHRGYCATLEDNREKLAYDLFYIKNRSFALDALILFQTIKIVLLGRGGR